MQLLGTKKIRQPLGTKKSHNLLGQKKIMPPLGTKEIKQLLETKKNHATSRQKKFRNFSVWWRDVWKSNPKGGRESTQGVAWFAQPEPTIWCCSHGPWLQCDSNASILHYLHNIKTHHEQTLYRAIVDVKCRFRKESVKCAAHHIW